MDDARREAKTPQQVHRDGIYTAKDIQTAFRIGDKTFREWKAEGLEPLHPGKSPVFLGREIIEFLKRKRSHKASPSERNPRPRIRRGEVFTAEELEKGLHVGDKTLRKWIEGGLRPLCGTQPRMFDGDDVIDFLKELREKKGQNGDSQSCEANRPQILSSGLA